MTGSDLVSSGEQGGGPYSPGFTSYILTNIGQSPINYTVSHASAWIAVSNAAGTLAPGGTATVTVSINALAANALSAGPFADMIAFTNTTNGRGTTARPASLTVLVPGTLSVSPTTAVASTGEFGGPFTPFSASYTLTNTGETDLTYDAGTTLAWLTLGGSPTGSLAPGATATVSAAINANADTLLPGTFSGGIFFVNTKNGRGNTSVPWSLLVVDTTAPVITAPPDVTAEATGPQTTVAIGTATATDAVGVVLLTSDAPATFPVGVTTVTWTATDAAGNSATATQTVTVQDTIAPVITGPADVTANATGPLTTVAIGTATATDLVGVVSITSDAPAAGFPVDSTTVVTWTATDAAGNFSTTTQTVTVRPFLLRLGIKKAKLELHPNKPNKDKFEISSVRGKLKASLKI